MTREEKQLLFIDLCARLPYGVYVDAYSWQKDTPKLLVECVPEYVGEEIVVKGLAGRHSIKEIKPYLRPMSSMTKEEEDEYQECGNKDIAEAYIHLVPNNRIDWLNEHHFDYRGLIPMGLALEAPKDMYKTE